MVVLVVALIVLGPEKLPGAARSIGKAMAELRRITSGFESEVRAAIDDAGIVERPAAAPDHGIDPGTLPSGMSFGRPVSRPEPTAAPAPDDDV